MFFIAFYDLTFNNCILILKLFCLLDDNFNEDFTKKKYLKHNWLSKSNGHFVVVMRVKGLWKHFVYSTFRKKKINNSGTNFHEFFFFFILSLNIKFIFKDFKNSCSNTQFYDLVA